MTSKPTQTRPAPSREARSLGKVPRSVDQILILARYQMRDYLRSRRFLILLILIAAIGAILTAVVGYYRPAFLASPVQFYASLWGNAATFVIVLAGIFFGGDAIAGEFQNRTGYFLMGLPIRRVTVYVGKYIAALVASLAILLVFAAILIANALYYFGGGAFPWQLGASFGLACFYLLALLGATFLFSSMFKTSTYATVLTALLFLFGFTILQQLIAGLVGVEPWMIISYSSGVIGNVFLDPYPPNVVTVPGPGGNTFTQYNPALGTGIGIMVAYFVLTGLGGLFFFERKEFS